MATRKATKKTTVAVTPRSGARGTEAKGTAAKSSRPTARASAKPAPSKASPPSSPAAEETVDDGHVWTLRLYVAGDSPKSRTALANLRRLCENQHPRRFEIEVVDLKKRPELAKADQILAVPTLIRKIPEPMKRIIGDLSNADRALMALELVAREG